MLLAACGNPAGPLPRGKASAQLDAAFENYLKAVAYSSEDLHGIMVLKHGKVLEEKQIALDTAHIMNSVSKTFTATAVGFAIEEGLLHLEDKIVDLFPGSVPTDPTYMTRSGDGDWIRSFMEWPLEYEPGTCYCYNSLGTYLLSAAGQKVSGEKVVDYLEPRLWKPLGMEKPFWQKSPAGINTGGWGQYLHTEEMARMGLCLLNSGKFAGKQVIPAAWVAEMSKAQVPSVNAGINERNMKELVAEHPEITYFSPENSDWVQGYGYQIWRCRHNAFRADGANGQYIVVIPEKDAVVVSTAHIQNMQQEIDLIWSHKVPVEIRA